MEPTIREIPSVGPGTRAGRQVDLGDDYLITHDLVFAML
jgi:hypothetical protein